jgi:hypothetical protein
MLIGREKLQLVSATWREYSPYKLLYYIHQNEIAVSESPFHMLIHSIHNAVISTAARVWSQVKLYRICGGKIGLG